MKKDIIISEADFIELEKYAKIGKNNTYNIRLWFNITHNNQVHFYTDTKDIESNLPEDFKNILNDGIEGIHKFIERYKFNIDNQLPAEDAQQKLDKIPNWIKNIFS